MGGPSNQPSHPGQDPVGVLTPASHVALYLVLLWPLNINPPSLTEPNSVKETGSNSAFASFLIVVQIQLSPFSPHHPPLPHRPSHPTLNPTHLWLCPWDLYACSLMTLPLLSPIILLALPLWLLSVCSLFQCPWLYFARLFVLLIRFHLCQAVKDKYHMISPISGT